MAISLYSFNTNNFVKKISKTFISITVSLLISFVFVSAFVYASTTIGTNIDTGGTLSFNGATSGKITLQPQAIAGTYTLSLPSNVGTANQVLQTDGSGVLSWMTVAAGGLSALTETDGSVTVDNTDTTRPTVGLPYKVYTALLSQSGSDNPAAIVLQNTLGATVTWTKVSDDFTASIPDGFDPTKTVIFGTAGNAEQNNAFFFSASVVTDPLDPFYKQVYCDTFKPGLTSPSIGWGSYVSIEIRVYP
jgi:hypothetical protein